MTKYLTQFFYILPARKSKLLILSLLFLVVSIIETFGIGLIGPFISLASNPSIIQDRLWLNRIYQYSGLSQETYFIAFLGLFIIIVFSVKSIISWRVQSYIFIFSSKQKVELTTQLMNAYLLAPYTFHLKKSSASVIQNVVKETDTFSTILSTLLTAISNAVVILCLAFLLSNTNSFALISLLIIAFPLFLLLEGFKFKVIRWGKELSKSNEAIIRHVNHGLGSIKETRIIGCESHFQDQIREQAMINSNAAGSFYAFKLCPRILVETLLVIFLVGFTSLILIFNQQEINQLASVLSIFAIASIRLIPSFTNLANGVSKLQSSSYALNKLYLDLKELQNKQTNQFQPLRKSEKDFSTPYHSRIPKLTFSKEIVLQEISYRYPETTELVLNKISLNIQKGESIALIGKSGAGKTTLVDVVLGLLLPQEGDIIVDGRSVYDNLRSWQNLIGYIPQSIFLIEDTIKKNIAFGIAEDLIDYQKLHKAIEAAQLKELVDELPNGLETFVGERGVRLSGGQRQRIGIARALYHEREILVLDEATAALDNETESLVTEAIKSLSGQKTMIIIAHRLTTIEHCNRIYMMEKGQIIKSGSYQEVVLANQSPI
jgi:ABC-type multidrug transport system fused ATPase/permease subunit